MSGPRKNPPLAECECQRCQKRWQVWVLRPDNRYECPRCGSGFSRYWLTLPQWSIR